MINAKHNLIVKQSTLDCNGYGVFIEKPIKINQRICRYIGDIVFRYHPKTDSALEQPKDAYLVFTSIDENFADCCKLSDRYVSWLGIYYKPADERIEMGINGINVISFINHAEGTKSNTRLQVVYKSTYTKKTQEGIIIRSKKHMTRFLTKPPYIRVCAKKNIDAHSELSFDYNKEHTNIGFTRNPVLPPTPDNLEKLRHALALSSSHDSSSDSDSSSEISDYPDSSDMETLSHVQPETVDMEKMPILLRSFDDDIRDLRDSYEGGLRYNLQKILDLISKKQQASSIAVKYIDILKFIAKYKVNIRKRHKLNDAIDATANFAKIDKAQASDFLDVENRRINDHAFNITPAEWDHFIETGKAWSEDDHSRRKRRKTSSQKASQHTGN
ncbi:MAG: hypothetical protein B0D91_07880 [Oceanospirillales bacterium LUC14_002_19_P2]|nr:MAG: hypothetical protein B0D91_07880 [Oceanospirillales bacterium LUC14_002_19_P2]